MLCSPTPQPLSSLDIPLSFLHLSLLRRSQVTGNYSNCLSKTRISLALVISVFRFTNSYLLSLPSPTTFPQKDLFPPNYGKNPTTHSHALIGPVCGVCVCAYYWTSYCSQGAQIFWLPRNGSMPNPGAAEWVTPQHILQWYWVQERLLPKENWEKKNDYWEGKNNRSPPYFQKLS